MVRTARSKIAKVHYKSWMPPVRKPPQGGLRPFCTKGKDGMKNIYILEDSRETSFSQPQVPGKPNYGVFQLTLKASACIRQYEPCKQPNRAHSGAWSFLNTVYSCRYCGFTV